MSAVFHGFKKGNDDIRHFVFASPKDVPQESSSSSSAAVETKPLGSIKVEIYRAQVEGGVYHNLSKSFSVPTSHQQTSGDNIKFWKQVRILLYCYIAISVLELLL